MLFFVQSLFRLKDLEHLALRESTNCLFVLFMLFVLEFESLRLE